jgi:L,D-transpeptidase YcbB
LHGALRTAALVAWLGCGAATAADSTAWFEGGRPAPQAEQAVALLAAAASEGLDPRDYEADALVRAVGLASQGPPLAGGSFAGLERVLSAAMQRYLADLHDGRVDPRQIQHAFSAPRREPFDAAAVLQAALAARRLPPAASAAAPRLPLYAQLREALAGYRTLGDHPAWQMPLPALPVGSRGSAGKLEPGRAYAGLELLAQRLVVLGDLAPQALRGADATLYAAGLVEAVKAFQQRHGLAADGVIGKATLAQLQVPPAARVRQIELALERLRWTPLMQGPRMIVVNIPEFVLRAYEVQDGRIGVRREMKVVVGKAMQTQTPLIDEELKFIEFSPYWNVPPSIAYAETVPRLRRDAGYFEQQGFEFVAADGSVSNALTGASLDAVLAGKARIRQRPGPQNALGDIKFVFPNREHIYLHHTPATRLFERERRDFSHGCIRVEQPVELARFVLQGMPEWSEDRIRQAMSKGQSATLRVAAPVPVLIAYATTLVKGGRIHFFDDIYGHDRRLDEALLRRSTQLPPLTDRP